MTLILAGLVWSLLFRKHWVEAQVDKNLYAMVLLWGILFLPFVAMPTMVLTWTYDRFRRFKTQPVADAEDEDQAVFTRRQLLGSAMVALPVLATFGTGAFGLRQVKTFRVREITVRLRELPPALDGLRIAHLSDTHVGKFTRGRMLRRLAEAVNELEADLVLMTGDLIDGPMTDLPDALDMLRRIDRHKGLFIVEGNHDLFDSPLRFRDGVRDAGLPLLRNEAATVRVRGVKVQILGIAWSREDEELSRDVEQVAALREKDAFSILLAHHPHAFDRAAELGIPLTLAGHTHGGQLMLSEQLGAGPLMFRYWSGLYEKAGRALVVSNGAGNWFPLRVNAPAEIVHITLKRA